MSPDASLPGRAGDYADYVALREVGRDDLRRFWCMVHGTCLTPFP